MEFYLQDSAVIVKVIGVIRNQLTTYFSIADNDLRIVRNNQPSKQHIGSDSYARKYNIFISQMPVGTTVGDGFTDAYTDDNTTERTYNTIRSAIFQIECWAFYDLASDTSLEGLDIARVTRDMLMQQDTIEQLKLIGINIHSCTGVRPTFTINQSEQYESTPSFDMALTYNSKYTKDLGRLLSIDGATTQV